jgi:hypothetical protein
MLFNESGSAGLHYRQLFFSRKRTLEKIWYCCWLHLSDTREGFGIST